MKNLAFFTLSLIALCISCKRSSEKISIHDFIDNKVDSVLALMTLEEKIGQMQQLNSSKGISDNDYLLVKEGKVGSFLNADDLSVRNKLQKIAVEESRLGIPLIFGRDVIHGYRTIFPIPLGQSASWNTELVEKAARIAASEASSQGIDWTFSPMIDITRDPRWGRIAEGCGEDPFLTSIMGEAMMKGYQNGFTDSTSIVACAKHFAGYGAAEGGKDYNTTLIPETELRNTYLPPFKKFVNSGGLTLMSAFNNLNGIPASGNEFTLRQVLRNEWGFNGFVVSDWNSLLEMIVHGYCKDSIEVAFKALNAGVDMEMVGDAYSKNLYSLVQDGKISEKLIDEAVSNILRVKFAIGLFNKPFTAETDMQVLLKPEYLETAKELAIESCVLLKNKGNVLPLKKEFKKIAVIGPLADAPLDQLGTWIMDGLAENSITPLKALTDLFGQNIIYEKTLESSRDRSTNNFNKAVAAAKKADVVILFLGEEAILSGENHTRAFLELPGAQNELAEKIKATGKPVVAVIMAGRPLVLSNVEDKLDAILYAWHPGTMGGPALADLLTGKTSPSGKLTTSFPRFEGQIPVYYNHYNTGRPPSDYNTDKPAGDPVDPIQAAAAYLDLDYRPAYPFGYGLSYTSFEYSNLELSSDKTGMNDTLRITVNITNTGNTDGKEIAQIYIHDVYASIIRPVKELKGFQKFRLSPGESKKINFLLTKEDLSFYNNSGSFIAEPGDFEIYVGKNSSDVLKSRFYLKE